jgi:hypothetical protein
MSEQVVWIQCSWCEATYEGDEAVAAAEGWFQLEHPDLEDPQDYCSMECLISAL